MRYLGLLVAACCVFSCFFAQQRGESPLDTPTTPPTADMELDKRIQEILSSKHSYGSQLGPGVCECYLTLFRKLDRSGLAGLRAHQNDGIALQAAWQEVALTVPENPWRTPVRPEPLKLVWFLGFLEGRLHIQAPRWWAESLLDTRANRRGNIYPGGGREDSDHKSMLDRVRSILGMTSESEVDKTIALRSPEYEDRGMALKTVGNKTVLMIKKEAITLPDNVLQKTDSGKLFQNVSALLTTHRVYVAVHEDMGFPYQLACIDLLSGKIAWKSEVWGTWWGLGGGVHFMHIAIVEQDKRVVVFGSGTTGMHVEAFRADDGLNLFRFSTSYITTGE